MNNALKSVEQTCNVVVRAIQDDATTVGAASEIFGPGKARERLNACLEACGNETHPDKSVAFCLLSSERDLVPANVHQPSYNITDHVTGVETQVFGVVICGVPHGETGFRQEWLRLKAVEICDKIELISKNIATSDPHCSAAVTVLSLQSLADFILATNYPSDTKHFVLMIDAALEKAFARSYGVNLLDPKQCHPPNSNPLLGRREFHPRPSKTPQQ